MKFLLYTVQYFCMVFVTFMVMFMCSHIPFIFERAVSGALITGAIFALCHWLAEGAAAERRARWEAHNKAEQAKKIARLTGKG